MFDYDYDQAEIIRELGIEASDEDFKKHVLTRIDQLIDQAMENRVAGLLSVEDMKQFSNIETREAAQSFLREKVPTLDDLYADTLGNIVGDLKAALS